MVTTQLLLTSGADLMTFDSDGNTPLILSATYGHKDVVSLLLHHSDEAVISHANKSGRTALHMAAENDHADIIEELLEKGLSAKLTDTMGKTALSVAAQQGHYR